MSNTWFVASTLGGGGRGGRGGGLGDAFHDGDSRFLGKIVLEISGTPQPNIAGVINFCSYFVSFIDLARFTFRLGVALSFCSK